MAMFRKPKFDELEEKYLPGYKLNVENHSFKLTMKKKVPSPSSILHYDWKITLDDNITEFNVSMGSENFSPEKTRLQRIIDKLKAEEKYNYEYLANAINDTIEEIYRKYK